MWSQQPLACATQRPIWSWDVSEYSEAMAEFVRRVHPELKKAGFRKRRHAFNRSAEEGVVQVVSFQMGPKLPPGAEPIPPIRPDLYGLFTVNLGVAVREAWEQSQGPDLTFPAFIHDYDCQIRERLGGVLGADRDLWWSLDEPISTLGEAIGEALVGPGLDWLTGRETRRAILELWEEVGHDALPMNTALPIVMILRYVDRHEEAAAAMQSYYVTITDHAPHRRYVYEVARSLEIAGLAAP